MTSPTGVVIKLDDDELSAQFVPLLRVEKRDDGFRIGGGIYSDSMFDVESAWNIAGKYIALALAFRERSAKEQKKVDAVADWLRKLPPERYAFQAAAKELLELIQGLSD